MESACADARCLRGCLQGAAGRGQCTGACWAEEGGSQAAWGRPRLMRRAIPLIPLLRNCDSTDALIWCATTEPHLSAPPPRSAQPCEAQRLRQPRAAGMGWHTGHQQAWVARAGENGAVAGPSGDGSARSGDPSARTTPLQQAPAMHCLPLEFSAQLTAGALKGGVADCHVGRPAAPLLDAIPHPHRHQHRRHQAADDAACRFAASGAGGVRGKG